MPGQLTVIVPTCHRPAHLAACLEALAKQTRSPDLVLIVDDSGESSTDVVPLMQTPFPISLLRTPRMGPAAARNAAIERVSTTYVGFLDDDSVPEPEWSGECVTLFEAHPEVTAQLGRILWSRSDRRVRFSRRFLPRLRQKIYDSRHRQFTDPQYVAELGQALGRTTCDPLPGLSTHLSCGNCALRKEFLDQHGSFDTRFRTLSDREMAYRILRAGGVIAYNPRLRAGHDHDPSLVRAFRRTFRAPPYQRLLDSLYPERPWARGRPDKFVQLREPLTILERLYLASHRAIDGWASRWAREPRGDPLLSGNGKRRADG